jgi:hypothetical protein
VIDLHCHVLPGVDDGPAGLDESLNLARVAAAEGPRKLVATPHVNYRYPTSAATMLDEVERLNQALREAEIPVEVAPGAEIAHDPGLDVGELQALRLGGGPYLLPGRCSPSPPGLLSSASMAHRLVLVPGDGVGPEVVEAARSAGDAPVPGSTGTCAMRAGLLARKRARRCLRRRSMRFATRESP